MKTIKPSIKNLPSIVAATLDLERWKSQQISIVRGDLVLKHRMMADAVFPFMRSTFYRWAQLWPMVCPELARAPQVLAVGDLHVENFGTWRDLEGRLVWGVNDFDEAWPAAYASDLVRLLVSAYYAIGEEKLLVTRAAAREAIEAGYRDAMDKGGSPYVLAERHTWLRQIALSKLRDPVRFWQKIRDLPGLSRESSQAGGRPLAWLHAGEGRRHADEDAHRGAGQFGACANSGAFSMAWRAYCA